MKKLFRNRLKYLAIACALLQLTACNLMEIQPQDCPEGLYVSFVYDYNLHGDLFKDQVEAVTLYVLDENNRVVDSRSVVNTTSDAPLAVYGYQMHFPDLKPGNYHLYAVAMQADPLQLMKRPGAKFTIPTLAKGERLDDWHIKLRHADQPTAVDFQTPEKKNEPSVSGRIEGYELAQTAPLDTLWNTLQMPDVTVKPLEPAYAKVQLVRNTKHLSISLRQDESSQTLNAEDFELYIVDANSTVDAANNLVDEHPLLYRPYKQFTTEDPVNTDPNEPPHTITNHAARYYFSLNRLVLHKDKPEQNATLYIVERSSRRLVGAINLPWYLAYGRFAYEPKFNLTEQAYLDRQHEYNIDLVILGGQVRYLNLYIGILKWEKHFQLVEL